MSRRLALVALACATTTLAVPAVAQTPGYAAATAGTRRLTATTGLEIKVLVEAATLGGTEVEVAEITFPPGAGDGARGHRHEAVEIFYVLSGVLDHIVNGVSHELTPGMVGIVRPGDAVVHRVVGSEPVRALVIWAPGGEVERLARFFTQRPLER